MSDSETKHIIALQSALAEKLQKSLDIAHTVRVVDIGDCRQRFGVGRISFHSRKTHEATFEDVQRNVVLQLE